jgi:hypothetical protein
MTRGQKPRQATGSNTSVCPNHAKTQWQSDLLKCTVPFDKQEVHMTRFTISMTAFAAALLATAPGFAQTLTQPERPHIHLNPVTPASIGHSQVSQKTDGAAPTLIGPGSEAHAN